MLAIQGILSSCLNVLAIQGILSSCLFHTLTRDLVKCVGNTGNPLKLFISYLCKMCWQYRESSQVVYFIP